MLTCFLPWKPNVGVTGESPCQHVFWLAGTFAESTPGLSGRAQRSLMNHGLTGPFALLREYSSPFRAVVPDIPICKDFCLDTRILEGFSGCGARCRRAGQHGVPHAGP